MRVEEAQIIDIAPTVLYALGLPAPQEMDGAALAISSPPSGKPPVGRASCPTLRPPNPVGRASCPTALPRDAAYSADEQAQVEERLKALGYLD